MPKYAIETLQDDGFWEKLGEGPFDTYEEAQLFAAAEVGVQYRIVETVSEFAQALFDRGSSFTATTDGLGLMVAPLEHIANCPPGWVFVPQETATAELIQQALDHLKTGRDRWPKKPTAGKKTADQLLEEVFDSQDYIGH